MTETVKPADVSDAAWELAGFAMGWPGIAQQTLRARIAHAIDRRAPADGVREALVAELSARALALRAMMQDVDDSSIFNRIRDKNASLMERAAAALAEPAKPSEGDWRDDLASDERWNEGVDYAITQLCRVLGVDPKALNWDAATETLDGDVSAVLCNVVRAAYGDGWSSKEAETARIRAFLSAPTLSPPVQAEAVVERMAQAMWRAELDDLSPAASAVRHAALWGEESPNTQDKWRLRARAAASVLPAAPALKQEGM